MALGRIRRSRAGLHGGSLAAGRAQPPGRAGARGSGGAAHGRCGAHRAPTRRPDGCGDAGRGAPLAPALARGSGQAGADPRRADRHGAAGARDGARIAAVADARSNAQDALAEAHTHLAETEAAVGALAGTKTWRPSWRPRRRTRPSCARTSARAAPSSSHWSASIASRTERQTAIGVERERWHTRTTGAAQHIWAFFVENPPTITDADGKRVQLPKSSLKDCTMPRSPTSRPAKKSSYTNGGLTFDRKEKEQEGVLQFMERASSAFSASASLARPAPIQTTPIPRWTSSPPGSWNSKSKRPTKEAAVEKPVEPAEKQRARRLHRLGQGGRWPASGLGLPPRREAGLQPRRNGHARRPGSQRRQGGGQVQVHPGVLRRDPAHRDGWRGKGRPPNTCPR